MPYMTCLLYTSLWIFFDFFGCFNRIIHEISQNHCQIKIRNPCCFQNIHINTDIDVYKRQSGRVIHPTADERYLPYKPVKEILKELDSDDFVQCNRFVIVNRNYVETIDSVNRYVTFKNRTDSVEIGLTFKKNFLRRVFNG